MNYRVVVEDRITGWTHLCGIYKADTGEDAVKKARKQYRNLFDKLQTNTVSVFAYPTVLQADVNKRRRRVSPTVPLEV